MEEFRQELNRAFKGASNLSCTSSEFIDGYIRKVEYLYEAAPWKKVPGPWLLQLEISGQRFYAVIMGASDKNYRGVQFFSSMEDYQIMCSQSMSSLLKFFAVVFENGKKTQPSFFKVAGLSAVQITSSEVLFCEAALPAVADFITEGARLQAELTANGPAGHLTAMVTRLTGVGSAANEFPCRQSISTVSRGEVEVRVTLIPTATMAQQLFTGQHANRPPAVVTPLPESMRMCIVCHKTQSDLHASGGNLKTCSRCGSQTDRYCGAECQRADWARHKKTCKPVKSSSGSS